MLLPIIMLRSYFITLFLITCFQLAFGQTNNFLIAKNSAGSIKLGMTDKEAIDNVLRLGYDTTTVDAWNYLIDGGGTGTEVSKDGEVLLFFWTFWNDDLIHGINIVSDKYKTKNGISTGSTVADLLKINANYQIIVDIEITSTEYIKDDKLNSQFIFLTRDDNRIGKYDFEQWKVTSEPKRLEAKIDWITFWQGSFAE